MKILVIGDSCTDIFIYGNIERINPEAPVPVFLPTKTVENLGMAGNVADNISSLGIDCDLITNESQITKTRYVENKSNQMLLRVDENDTLPENDKFNLIKNSNKVKGYDALVISDYDKGFLSSTDIEYLLNQKIPTFLQTNKKLDNWAEKALFVKINELEYEESKTYIDLPDNLKNTNLIITLGSKGCSYKDKIYEIKNQVEIRDISGAGDTFLAGLIKEYLSSKDIEKSINYAQMLSTIVVQKKGVNIAGKSNQRARKI
jgi:bifunctional ADP-heptose synthase (sugar kinase/adenylyltransferase)